MARMTKKELEEFMRGEDARKTETGNKLNESSQRETNRTTKATNQETEKHTRTTNEETERHTRVTNLEKERHEGVTNQETERRTNATNLLDEEDKALDLESKQEFGRLNSKLYEDGDIVTKTVAVNNIKPYDSTQDPSVARRDKQSNVDNVLAGQANTRQNKILNHTMKQIKHLQGQADVLVAELSTTSYLHPFQRSKMKAELKDLRGQIKDMQGSLS